MRTLAPALLVIGALIASCKAKEGGSCSTEGAVVCADARTQLVCYAGKYASVACKGAEGCQGKDAHCDLSGNVAGDACSSKDEGRRFCSADHKTLLRCTNRTVTVAQTCPGHAGCTPNPVNKDFDCDQGEPVAGSACDTDHWECARDGERIFECVDGKWTKTLWCRGPKKCTSRDGCDRTVAADGEPCSRNEESRSTCGAGNRSVLQCDGGKLKTIATCPQGKRCVGDDAASRGLFLVNLAVNARCE